MVLCDALCSGNQATRTAGAAMLSTPETYFQTRVLLFVTGGQARGGLAAAAAKGPGSAALPTAA